jgi:ATP-dependent RNA helicase DeaD
MSSSDPATFSALGLRPELLDALSRLGYEEPTPIQQATIPPILAGRDLVGQAATGTGKTAAFALPALERLATDRDAGQSAQAGPGVLVLVPTRELAMQVSEAIHRYGKDLEFTVLPIFGGQPMGRQLQALKRGVDVVVATPGRAIDHINRGSLRLGDVRVAILDEADEMLDMGFADDIEEILNATPDTRQTVLFSATMPPRIAAIARRHLHDAERISIEAEPTPAGEEARVRETAYIVRRTHKAAAIGRILDIEVPAATLVFCRTRLEVEELAETLNGRGYQALALHGGMNQEQRDRVMHKVRNGAADLLVATDVAARGLDIDVLTHVVNYEVPSAPESYVHRIGRVGRAGREGVAITLVDPREHRMLKNIERVTRRRMEIATVPTVADLRSRRMETTLDAVREALGGDDLDAFRAIVDSLADDYDAVEIALAAIKLAHEATGSTLENERDIPSAQFPSDRPRNDRTRDNRPSRPQDRGDRDAKDDRGSRYSRDDRGRDAGHERNDRGPRFDRSDRGERNDRFDRSDRGDRNGAGRGRPGRPSSPRGRGSDRSMTRLYFAAGRSGGVRPQDLVGAIAGETSLSGRDVGAIEITDRFSLVEVPSESVDEVIDAMRQTTIKGKRTTVRRERYTRP